MIITISGTPGSGKSTVAKLIAKKLNYKHYSMGDLQRSIAEKRGMHLMELSKLEEADSSIDKEVDQTQANIGKKEDNFIIDGRISYHFIPHSVKVFLDVDLKEAAERIYKAKREEESFKDIKDAEKHIKRRIKSEKRRYKNYYNIDCYDKSNYDILLDTTNMSIEEVVDTLLKKLERFIK